MSQIHPHVMSHSFRALAIFTWRIFLLCSKFSHYDTLSIREKKCFWPFSKGHADLGDLVAVSSSTGLICSVSVWKLTFGYFAYLQLRIFFFFLRKFRVLRAYFSIIKLWGYSDVIEAINFQPLSQTRQEHGQISSGARPKFQIFDGRLNLVSSIQWSSGRIVGLFWELDRDVINVLTENGKLLQVRGPSPFSRWHFEP